MPQRMPERPRVRPQAPKARRFYEGPILEREPRMEGGGLLKKKRTLLKPLKPSALDEDQDEGETRGAPPRLHKEEHGGPRVTVPDRGLSDHLGHFAKPEILREGHNTLPTPAKAKEMLRHGEARGRKLSGRQRGLLGLVVGGGRPTRMKK